MEIYFTLGTLSIIVILVIGVIVLIRQKSTASTTSSTPPPIPQEGPWNNNRNLLNLQQVLTAAQNGVETTLCMPDGTQLISGPKKIERVIAQPIVLEQKTGMTADQAMEFARLRPSLEELGKFMEKNKPVATPAGAPTVKLDESALADRLFAALSSRKATKEKTPEPPLKAAEEKKEKKDKEEKKEEAKPPAPPPKK